MTVYGVQFRLINEKNPDKIIATKYARIHESDIEAGEYHLAMKAKEIFRDALCELGQWPQYEIERRSKPVEQQIVESGK